MRPKISVIIPIYNVEEYIYRCVDSVLNQTLDNIEIVLVDDGSPDKCPYICDDYAKRDKRIKVIHKVNGGLASARNAGIEVSTGEYIFFLDSDDWIDIEGLECLCNIADENNVDFVRYRSMRTGWPNLPENAPCMLETIREIPGGYYDRARIKKIIYPRLLATNQLTLGPIVGACGSLYRLDFLRKNNLYFYEDIRYSEDILFSANVIKCAENFYYVDKAGIYHYFYNNKSISKSFRAGRFDSCKKLIRRAYEDFGINDEYDFKKELNYLTWFCVLLSLNERENIKDKCEKIKYCKKIIKDELVRNASLKTRDFDVSYKQKIILKMIKYRIWPAFLFF